MLIGLAKTVLCLTIFLNSTRAYQQQKYTFGQSAKATSRPVLSEYRVRHSFRHSKFGEVMTRINSFSKDVPLETSSKSAFNKKFRHKNWDTYYRTTTSTTTPEPLFDELTYGDYEEEDDDRSENDDEYDDEGDDDYDEDDQLFETITDDMQAEEATEPSTPFPSKPMSSFSEYKWNKLGTRSRVDQARQQHILQHQSQSPEQVKVNAFLEHYARVTKQTKCHKPLPKVIPVQQEHPNISKSYTPSCTVLHRCAEDTGCCNKNTKCQYKSRVLVQLYFYTNTLGGLQNRVEKLDFYNHTECECRSPDTESEGIPDDPAPNIPFRSSNRFASNPQNVKRCTCPTLFQDARYSNKCACDCAEGNEDCLRLKRGKEHFRLSERICIQDHRCGVPICEHGVYQMNLGKCPTKKEKLEEYSRVNLNFGRT